jgi:hypothetical protein
MHGAMDQKETMNLCLPARGYVSRTHVMTNGT